MNFQPKNLLKGMVAAAAAVMMVGAAQAADISGAGATFPYPIYAKWAEAYKAKTGVGLNYQSIGSGGGIKQIKAKTVTFGASDMPLKAEELKEAGLQQFPMIMGGVVPVINVKGIAPGQIQLDGPTIAKIYLGQIASWDDPAIKALNPGLNLPKTSIVPVYRSDGSGTNFLWTTYLSKEDKEFSERVGANTSVQWAAGLGAKGNEGVANMVKLTDGAIGYVEYAYAKQNTLTFTKLKNKEGKIVSPEIKAFQAAAAGADWANAPGFYLVLVDQPGADSWPITGASFILVYSQPQDGAAVAEALKFFDWAYNNGQAAAEQLDYVPMPAAVISQVEKSWSTIKTADGKPVWSK
ncbi:phosphate ABC transporter substrate-binding protein PstS [Nitrospirillum sp. BR 11828]|uniref:phosphate ABC transporter substrate-binding protein PstS n=1 Tax=Nitrospirillum sp. BR 11828 TaxID=3104325 RepID=UPI002ACAA86D|nr:phosphate ABC transporter substrate-binding protein PstS [Nitrospirillum sp. BR 11828]MDZ5647136.1 phosphate ABC transporter substrate-binding protein PstS [Nitrospirillum sp. BR 11828]